VHRAGGPCDRPTAFPREGGEARCRPRARPGRTSAGPAARGRGAAGGSERLASPGCRLARGGAGDSAGWQRCVGIAETRASHTRPPWLFFHARLQAAVVPPRARARQYLPPAPIPPPARRDSLIFRDRFHPGKFRAFESDEPDLVAATSSEPPSDLTRHCATYLGPRFLIANPRESSDPRCFNPRYTQDATMTQPSSDLHFSYEKVALAVVELLSSFIILHSSFFFLIEPLGTGLVTACLTLTTSLATSSLSPCPSQFDEF
jgi:hypothetical protein